MSAKTPVNKILLKGYYGFGNLGDDILMIVSYNLLKEKYPEASIDIFSNHTPNLNGFKRSSAYNQYIWQLLGEKPELIDWTSKKEYDLVFNGGGGVFFDVKHGSAVYGVINTIFKIAGSRVAHRVDRLLRVAFNKPRHIRFRKQHGAGIGIGPYSKRSALFFRHLAEIGSFEALFVRDDVSMQFLASMNFAGQRFKFTDLAFLSDYWVPEKLKAKKEKTFGNKLGILLQDLPSRQEELFSAVEGFLSSVTDAEVTFLSFDKNHDQEYIRRFSSRHRLVVWDPEVISMESFLEILASQNIIITARAHGAILGALLGVVPICLGVSPKLEHVSQFFPNGGLLVKPPFDQQNLSIAWEKARHDYTELTERLQKDVMANRTVAQEGKQRLFEIR